MTAINNFFPAVGISVPAPAQGARSESGNSNSDGFGAMFERAAGESRTSADPGRAWGSETKRSQKPPSAGEGPYVETPEKPPPDEDLADGAMALAAIVMPPVIQAPNTVDVTDAAADSAPADMTVMTADMTVEQGGSAIVADTPDIAQVVSNLESNKEIDAPAADHVTAGPESGSATATAQPEQTARMPQTPGNIPEEDAVKTEAETAPADTGAPCPLESENNTERNSGAPDRHGREREDPKPQDTRVFGESQTVDISPERLISSEQLSETVEAAPQTAAVETLYDTLVESIFTASTSESKFMEIQLKPEFLGKVAIQLTLGDSGLEIKIKADDAGVKSLIAGQITQLTASLSDKGVKVASVDVIFANVADRSFDGSNHQRQDARQAGAGFAGSARIDFGFGFTEDGDEVSVIDTGISSVEYRV